LTLDFSQATEVRRREFLEFGRNAFAFHISGLVPCRLSQFAPIAFSLDIDNRDGTAIVGVC
jgi:hypothetical protein